MAPIAFLTLLCGTLAATYAYPHPEAEIITQPEPGQEYVFVQSSSTGARPIARKDKQERPFETAHKLPPTLTFTLKQDEVGGKEDKRQKRETIAEEGPAPAPAGAIKLDISKLLDQYKTELKTSTTAKPKTTSRRERNRRIKKEAKEEAVVTSPSPVLTTGVSVAKAIDDDDDDGLPLVASGSEKQRSRIQYKKGPNGQEYEYEYVYYYYDDIEEPKEKQKVSNSHDGPARNQITQAPKRGHSAEKTSATPEANEVVPSTRGRTRGRQLGEEEVDVGEERLPANTRFPPRSRNLNTTPLPEEETKATRGRGRGRPTTEGAPESDNVSDETQGSRGRTRANVRRPSLELVDNASFNTHSNTAGAEPSSGGPSFPTDLPAGPVRFLGATPNESVDLPETAEKVASLHEESKVKPEVPEVESVTVVAGSDDTTTAMSPMDKVALDLYAILQGTQRLSGEDEASSDEDTTNATDEPEITTVEVTTEVVETTPSTTTTTTTTTQAPTTRTTTTTTTTTTTEAAQLGRGRYKGRGGRKTTHAPTTTEGGHTETKPKGKFNRPSFGNRPRPGARSTTEAAVEEISKEESKPVSHARPTLSRSRFGASRPRARTTAAPESSTEDGSPSSTAAPASRPSLTRPRSSFNLRTRSRTTSAIAEPDTSSSEEPASSPEATSTTTRSRRIGTAGAAIRPLRPGPRINLARGRPGQTTTTTTSEAAPVEDHVTGDEDGHEESSSSSEEAKDAETAAPPVDNSPLGRLRNRNRVNVQARPKAAASAPVQVRRINPLVARRRPGQAAEPTSSEAPLEPSTEAAPAEEAAEETESAASSSTTTTTEEPRGLNKLLAGRRRLARPGAHH